MKREDEWLHREDMILVEAIIKGVSEGRTQLDIFEEVGELLSRTPGAVGFRWNKELRGEYKSMFEKARNIGLEAKKNKRARRSQQLEELLEKENSVEPAQALTAKYVDPDFDKEWEEATLKDNTQTVVSLPKSRIQSQTVETQVYSLNGLTETELLALEKLLDFSESEILEGLRYDIKATLSR